MQIRLHNIHVRDLVMDTGMSPVTGHGYGVPRDGDG